MRVAGVALVSGTRARVVCAITIHNGLITRLDFVLAPDKLPGNSLAAEDAER